jgi:hypothetical protein
MKTVTYNKNSQGRVVVGLSFIMMSLSFGSANAQTFTQRLQQQVKGEGVVSIHQDKAIEELVNGPHPAPAPVVTTVKTAEKNSIPAKKTTPKKQEDNKSASKQKSDTAKTRQEGNTPKVAQHEESDTTSVQPKRTYRATGYRVQVYAGGNSRNDRQKAERMGNELRTLFPEHQVYVHFYSPRWICRIGNFKTYAEANQLRASLKQMGYSTTNIVKGKVTLQY